MRGLHDKDRLSLHYYTDALHSDDMFISYCCGRQWLVMSVMHALTLPEAPANKVVPEDGQRFPASEGLKMGAFQYGSLRTELCNCDLGGNMGIHVNAGGDTLRGTGWSSDDLGFLIFYFAAQRVVAGGGDNLFRFI